MGCRHVVGPQWSDSDGHGNDARARVQRVQRSVAVVARAGVDVAAGTATREDQSVVGLEERALEHAVLSLLAARAEGATVCPPRWRGRSGARTGAS